MENYAKTTNIFLVSINWQTVYDLEPYPPAP